jgi:predicted GIY-YIG superfamily endonuclease
MRPCSHRFTVAATRCYHLYRLYDAEDRLLYIGFSNSAHGRIRKHVAEKPWAGEIVRAEISEPIATYEQAQEAESIAIDTENPLRNMAPGVWLGTRSYENDRKRARTSRTMGKESPEP